MSLKILFLVHRIPWPLKDGGAIANYNILKSLTDAGAEVKMLAMNPVKDNVNTDDLPPVFKEVKLEFININTKIKPLQAALNLFSDKAYNLQRFLDTRFLDLINKTLKERNYDLIHFEGLPVAQYLPLIESDSKIKKVLREHNVEYHIWEKMASGTGNPLKRFYFSLLAKRVKRTEEGLFAQMDAVVAITPDDAAVFQKMTAAEKVFNGGQGFILDNYSGKEKPLVPGSVFHLGAMNWMPNVEAVRFLLNDIWPEINKMLPDLTLYLAGKNMPADILNRKVNKAVVCGEVPDAAGFMADKEVMLVPLKSGSGIRIKIIEGMAMGKIVITTTLGASGLGAGPGRELLIADTLDEFVLQLQKLQSQPELKKEIAENAIRFAHNNFSNEVAGKRLLSFYSNLAAKV